MLILKTDEGKNIRKSEWKFHTGVQRSLYMCKGIV